MNNTIAAISTPHAPGGIGVIRISGDDAINIADRVFRGKKHLKDMPGYNAAFGSVIDGAGEKIDDVVALVFKAPKSYTGENVVEISCHGGLFVTNKILQIVLDTGAEIAQPGEFTKRAFLNGKMDLTQAEAVMQIISAENEQSIREAIAGSDGLLSKRIEALKENLIFIASHLSAWADFPDEDVPEVEQKELLRDLENAEKEITKLLHSYENGRIMREGITAAIVGKTNAGKSTLMNLLSGTQRSIVTQIAGTTRDIVEETVLIGGILIRLADTAGIRDSYDPVEQIGISKSWDKLKTCELIFAVFDATTLLDKYDLEIISKLNRKRTIAVINKSDLKANIDIEDIKRYFENYVLISAKNGEGIDKLSEMVLKMLKADSFNASSGSIYTDRQYRDAKEALASIIDARMAVDDKITLDAVTVCIEDAISALCRLTGEKVSDEIAQTVFSTFCVGK